MAKTTHDGDPAVRWLILLARMPTEPARHRMAVWRELRRSGAVLVGSSAWALPNLPTAAAVLGRVRELIDKAEGTLITLDATGHDSADDAALLGRYDDARRDEWAEFEADCGKYLRELEKEERIGKYTLGELEEEEQSLDRLRRWYRQLRSRDLVGSATSSEASQRLKACEARFDDFAEHTYAALSGRWGTPSES